MKQTTQCWRKPYLNEIKTARNCKPTHNLGCCPTYVTHGTAAGERMPIPSTSHTSSQRMATTACPPSGLARSQAATLLQKYLLQESSLTKHRLNNHQSNKTIQHATPHQHTKTSSLCTSTVRQARRIAVASVFANDLQINCNRGVE